MADLQRSYPGDFFRPPLAPDSAASPYHAGSALKNPFPREISSSAQTAPRQQSAMAPPAPSTPSPGPTARRGCGGRGVNVWCFNDPEFKRRRRVAGYKAYAVKGKVKASLCRGLRWFKRKCSGLFHV